MPKPDDYAVDDQALLHRELAVAVAAHDARRLLLLGGRHDQVAGLLRNPGAIRVSGHPEQMDAATFELDEEAHVQASQPERLDREEVTFEDPAACWRSNSRQLRLARLGAGSMP